MTDGIVIVSPGGMIGGFSGGMGTVTRAMAGWLGENAPERRVTVLDPRGNGRAIFWPLHLVKAMAQLVWVRLTTGASILHLQVSRRSSFTRKGVLLVIGRAMGMHTVLHHHGSEFIEFYHASSPRMQAWVRWLIAHADVNIVLGERWNRFLVDELAGDPARNMVMYNGTPDPGSDMQDRDPWNLLITANLSARKGVDELLKAVKTLVGQGHPVRLTLAGGGQVEHYRAEAARLGIADRCQFPGWLDGDQVRQLMLTHGILVLPSHKEGLPMAILEALGAGLPVIATPVGSIPEVLKDGETCLLVEPGQAEALAQAIARLASDETLRAGLRQKGRALFQQRFNLDPYMRELVALYDRL